MGLGVLGTHTLTDSFTEARGKGRNATDSLLYAIPDAAIEVATERLPFLNILKGFKSQGGDAVQAFKKFIVQDLVGEQIATGGQSLNAYLNNLDDELNNPNLSTRDKIAIQAERQAVTAIASGITTGSIVTPSITYKKGKEFSGNKLKEYVDAKKAENVSIAESVPLKEINPDKAQEVPIEQASEIQPEQGAEYTGNEINLDEIPVPPPITDMPDAEPSNIDFEITPEMVDVDGNIRFFDPEPANIFGETLIPEPEKAEEVKIDTPTPEYAPQETALLEDSLPKLQEVTGSKTLKPVTNFVKTLKIDPDSVDAQEIKNFGITPTNVVGIFSKQESNAGLDNVPADEFTKATGIQPEIDTDGYVSRGWLLDAIQTEALGGSALGGVRYSKEVPPENAEEFTDGIVQAKVIKAQAQTPVKIDNKLILAKEVPIKQKLQEVKNYVKATLVNKVVKVKEDKTEVLLPWQGFKKALSGKLTANKILSTSQIDKILENSIHVAKEPDVKKRANILAIHKYLTPVEIDNKNTSILTVVREHLDGKRYYDHNEYIENLAPGELLNEVTLQDYSREASSEKARTTPDAPLIEASPAQTSETFSSNPPELNNSVDIKPEKVNEFKDDAILAEEVEAGQLVEELPPTTPLTPTDNKSGQSESLNIEDEIEEVKLDEPETLSEVQTENVAQEIKPEIANEVHPELVKDVTDAISVLPFSADIKVVESPEAIKAPSNTKGLWQNGEIYLVAKNITDTQDAVRVALHEAVGHGGLRNLLGEKLNPVLDPRFKLQVQLLES